MNEWDKLWEPELEGLPSLAEIFMKTERYAPVMYPWLHRVKTEGDRLQEENDRLSRLSFAKRITNAEGKLEAIRGLVKTELDDICDDVFCDQCSGLCEADPRYKVLGKLKKVLGE